MPTILTPEVAAVLKEATIQGNSLHLPPEPLDRKLYSAVNKHITNCGGFWSKRTKTHEFPSNPSALLGLVLSTGKSINAAHEKKKARAAFYTPSEIAKQVAEIAKVKNFRVLEPSAGGGALADACMAAGAARVECIELDAEAAEALSQRYCTNQADFLTVQIDAEYSRIIMNPPFTRGSDAKHVARATEWLSKGGTLHAIVCDPGQPRPELEVLGAQVIHRWPKGAFKASGTQIATMLIKITK